MFHLRHHSGEAPDAVMRAMFAARKSVFVDLLKWDVPVLDGRYELDQFDNEHAHYLILTDDDGAHLASARLLQTSKPHILGDLFPQLCANGAPCADDVVEITRFCLDRSLNAPERREVRDQLVINLVEHALAHGITRYVAIAEMGWFQQILAFGWDCRPLGLPHDYQGSTVAALSIAIDSDTPAQLTRAGVIAMPPSPDTAHRAAA
jgi:N-acyl-L-homoserine lactone synthetase